MRRGALGRSLLLSCALLLPSAYATKPASAQPVPFDYDAIVAAEDRSDGDRALDAGRHPAELLRFLGVRPGMRVAELAAGGGYTTELLARVVGPTGTVYGQNSPFLLERFAEKPWSERLARPALKNVVRVDREFASPLPEQARDLDVVVMNLFYHDMVWQEVDRQAMARAIFAALRPGGIFVVIDHSARDGRGIEDVRTLHRIEESVVRAELAGVGFVLVGESSVWRNPDDTRDWNAAPGAAGERRGTSDRFALKLQRPATPRAGAGLARP